MLWLIIQVYLNSFLNGIFSHFLLNGIHHVRGSCILHLLLRGWGLSLPLYRIHTHQRIRFRWDWCCRFTDCRREPFFGALANEFESNDVVRLLQRIFWDGIFFKLI
jgi:hypothetical protein